MDQHIFIYDHRRRSLPRVSCYDSPYRGSVTDASLSSYGPPLRRSARWDPPRRDSRDERRSSPSRSEEPRPREEREHGVPGEGIGGGVAV